MNAKDTIVRRIGYAVRALALVAAIGRAGAQSLTISGSPALMEIQAGSAGSAPPPKTDNSTSYTVIQLSAGTHAITAQLNASMPTGLTLTVTLAAPGGGSRSVGAVALDATSRDVVTGIGFTIAGSKQITYNLNATAAAGVVPRQSRTVITLTVVSTP